LTHSRFGDRLRRQFEQAPAPTHRCYTHLSLLGQVRAAVPTYRCFCLTADNRIISGAHIRARDAEAAVEAATVRWSQIPKLHFIEVWRGSGLLRREAVTPRSPVRGASQGPDVLREC
jgi:hypothetical protein